MKFARVGLLILLSTLLAGSPASASACEEHGREPAAVKSQKKGGKKARASKAGKDKKKKAGKTAKASKKKKPRKAAKATSHRSHAPTHSEGVSAVPPPAQGDDLPVPNIPAEE